MLLANNKGNEIQNHSIKRSGQSFARLHFFASILLYHSLIPAKQISKIRLNIETTKQVRHQTHKTRKIANKGHMGREIKGREKTRISKSKNKWWKGSAERQIIHSASGSLRRRIAIGFLISAGWSEEWDWSLLPQKPMLILLWLTRKSSNFVISFIMNLPWGGRARRGYWRH